MKKLKRLVILALFAALTAIIAAVSGSYASAFGKTQITGTVGIKGDVKVGNVITADLSGVSPEGATVDVSWIVDGKAVKAKGYRVKQSEAGKSISVRIDGTGEYQGSLISDPEEIGIEYGVGAPVLSVGSVSAFPGETVAVPIYVTTDQEIAILVLAPVVPEGFGFDRAENGNVFSSITYESSVLLDTGSKDGVAATLFINVPENAASGVYPLMINVIDCVNMKEKTVVVKTENGSLTVALSGDVNGDGSVTALDIIRLKKYLAAVGGAAGSQVINVGAGADANGDNVVDVRDVARLKRYFAEYGVLSGKSTVHLGKES